MAERNYTYLLRCADGTLYCGWTNGLEKRVAAHNAGTGSLSERLFFAQALLPHNNQNLKRL